MSGASAVARVILAHRPGATDPEIHALLYYCQVFALAWSDVPLFGETIQASRHGPVVVGVDLEGDPSGDLSDRARKVVETVLRFFSDRDGAWLAALVQRSTPWREARGAVPLEPESQPTVDWASLSSYGRVVAQSPSALSEPLKRGLDVIVDTPLDELDALLSGEEVEDEGFEQWLLTTPPSSECQPSGDCDDRFCGAGSTQA